MEPSSFKSRIIDPLSGDVYSWDNFEKAWLAKCNTGIHNRYVSALNPLSKHVSTRPKFYTASVEHEYTPTPSIANEFIVNVKKELVQTEMVKNLKSN